ncbi:hypothetical protein [Pararobbsia silviterrae]|uniref:Uncharacterized protein n=1 Tax=Pararobbsia silviterrae TaxID=1792498 RepID=A0A494WZ33_9BURK|nr:hypothetical protein [Pararobbsia silviterrae]RKP43788.1 hypothetical protein D7S86_28370 [Pararobbsia silviterrae]
MGANTDIEIGAGALDLLIEQGADWQPTFTFQNDDGTAINLLGSVVRLQVRSDFGVATTLLDASSSNGLITLDTENGVAAMNVSAAQTAALSPDLTQLFQKVYGRQAVRLGVYDVHVVSPSGVVTSYLAGSVFIAPAVTKDS